MAFCLSDMTHIRPKPVILAEDTRGPPDPAEGPSAAWTVVHAWSTRTDQQRDRAAPR
ncbi:hypothetical protein STRTUCAR8_05718 [Streptomyces turgidiscabies Car8]|uniref:Uncharacterized protein n=1 Tax=Streptomyces turgidiscabies (strain Car8) TaxID=698760 RepID=L7EYR7_STRT8|nr:hypothetical protein STRTUCAR8_05718 [Streptomyces turgidiscabies Car8]